MDISTNYLGLKLTHPLVVGASPLAADLDQVRRLEDAGAAAIVMHSLFEEQLQLEQSAQQAYVDAFENANAEALSYLPKPAEYVLGPDDYLEQIRKLKAAVGIPVIGSLNGVTDSGWLDHAKMIQDAGADALELNVYSLPTNPEDTASTLEHRLVDMVRHVKSKVQIPVAVKLSPFFTSPVNVATQLVAAKADGLTLFNRFYQPDIDIERLEGRQSLDLSTSAELRLRLRWLAVISSKVKVSLALTGGVHTATDAIKAVMAGASAVQVVSAILVNGPAWITKTRDEMGAWLETHEYESLAQALGSMNLSRTPDPGVYERGNYMKMLQSWTKSSPATT
jgi:dihydroorotate dehydrogenase (fumarate)